MEIELGDSKGTYRWGMLPGMGTPSTRGIGYRTSVDIWRTFDGFVFILKFLDEIRSDSKTNIVGKCAAGLVKLLLPNLSTKWCQMVAKAQGESESWSWLAQPNQSGDLYKASCGHTK